MEKDKQFVREIFNDIAPKYDFLNRFLSFGIDRLWRKRLIKILKRIGFQDAVILDAATGTADMAIQLAALNPKKIFGIDIAVNMLKKAQKKIIRRGLQNVIELKEADSEHTNFNNEFFDLITCVFGVRNFENLDIGLREFNRILKKNGYLAILEFSNKRNKSFDLFFKFYFSKILPIIGKKLSNNEIAYYYLPKSVEDFPSGDDFCRILQKYSFKCILRKKLSFGVVYLYIAIKIQ